MSTARTAARGRRRSRYKEADIAASIEHANVIPIYEAEDDGLLFLAMRYVDGTDLREWLVRKWSHATPPRRWVVAQVGTRSTQPTPAAWSTAM